ncbi:hypothetical protein FQN54_002479 [Arachnomyces sp. PD_36]|nr:hypothetical protein FQN54_002479 [Arachnomyces sp. PD_36]
MGRDGNCWLWLLAGVMSGLLTGDAFVRNFPEIDTTKGGNGSATLQGTVVAIYEIGCFLGALLCLAYGEKLGRRMCIMAGCIILSVGAALQASAYSIPHMIVGRIVAGIGNGMNTSTIPVWHSELIETDKRMKLAIELAINIFGVMLSYWVDYGFSYVMNESQFRFPLALQILFALVTFAGVIFLPESPRWLIAHDRHSEARRVIWSLQWDAHLIEEDDTVVNVDMEEITLALAEEQQATSRGGFLSMFKNGEQKFLYRTLLGMGGQFMQQISGINLITYVRPNPKPLFQCFELTLYVKYATVIFEQSVGMDHNTALLVAGFNGIAYFFSSLVPIWTIDRLGRRKLMLFAVGGQCACMAILAGTVYDGGKPAGIVATIMLFLFNFFFAVGLLAIPWLLPAEYAPLAIRTRAASMATATNWLCTFLVVEITPVSIQNIGWKTYLYFAIFNFFFIPLIYLFYPETRNLTLEQVDKLFTGEKVLLHWHPSMGVAKNSTFSDESRPTCTRCKNRGEDCEWRVVGSFREANMKVLEPQHPSMKQASNRKSRRFEIFNVTPGLSCRGSKEGAPGEGGNGAPCEKLDTQTPRSAEDKSVVEDIGETLSPTISRNAGQQNIPTGRGVNGSVLYPSPSEGFSSQYSTPSYHSPGLQSNKTPNTRRHTDELSSRCGPQDEQATNPKRSFESELDVGPIQPNHTAPQSTLTYTRGTNSETRPNHNFLTHPDFAVAELMALRYFPTRPSDTHVSHIEDNSPQNPIIETTEPFTPPLPQPDLLDEQLNLPDDIFLPGSAYEALHTTLRNRQLYTAQSCAPSRQQTPTSVLNVRSLVNDTADEVVQEADPLRSGKLSELTPYREYVLWQNYLEEICSWLDMFDNNKHFAHTFSQMAKSVPHLRYSILALSARQMERMDPRQSQSESLALYQEAIHLLLPELEMKTTPVIASCVILCVLEMLSCNPKEWRRHLDGCAYLIQAAGINGFSGKEEQALFWCFARMGACTNTLLYLWLYPRADTAKQMFVEALYLKRKLLFRLITGSLETLRSGKPLEHFWAPEIVSTYMPTTRYIYVPRLWGFYLVVDPRTAVPVKIAVAPGTASPGKNFLTF